MIPFSTPAILIRRRDYGDYALILTFFHFTWGTFCDWYVELVKGAFDDETKAVAAWAFDLILVMLHPFMPFVTEELWHAMGQRPYDLILAKWPAPEAKIDHEAKAELEWLIGLIQNIRATKAALGAADKTVVCFISKAEPNRFATIDRYLLSLKRMCRLDQISVRTPHGVEQLGGSIAGIEIDADIIIAVEGEGMVQVP